MSNVSYQWQRGDTPDGVFADIPSATNDRYEVGDGDFGKYVRVAAGIDGKAVSAVSAAVLIDRVDQSSRKPVVGDVVLRQNMTLREIHLPEGWAWVDADASITNIGYRIFEVICDNGLLHPVSFRVVADSSFFGGGFEDGSNGNNLFMILLFALGVGGLTVILAAVGVVRHSIKRRVRCHSRTQYTRQTCLPSVRQIPGAAALKQLADARSRQQPPPQQRGYIDYDNF